jgi:phosphoribosyl-ATP pyrophosphohydrolase
LSLGAALAAPLVSDREDGLWPTIVADEAGRALGLAWSDLESLSLAIESGKGAYRSRRRGLWVKGEDSGNVQELIRAELDCDRDSLRFVVRQTGSGFCHLGTWSCFGGRRGLDLLERTVAGRVKEAPEGSYTRRLLESPSLLASKLREEAAELARAAGRSEAVAEAADLFYFALAKLVSSGATMAEVEEELDRRSLRVTRRGGAPKAAYSCDSPEGTWAGLH